jgi:hypothetical protein
LPTAALAAPPTAHVGVGNGPGGVTDWKLVLTPLLAVAVLCVAVVVVVLLLGRRDD